MADSSEVLLLATESRSPPKVLSWSCWSASMMGSAVATVKHASCCGEADGREGKEGKGREGEDRPFREGVRSSSQQVGYSYRGGGSRINKRAVVGLLAVPGDGGVSGIRLVRRGYSMRPEVPPVVTVAVVVISIIKPSFATPRAETLNHGTLSGNRRGIPLAIHRITPIGVPRLRTNPRGITDQPVYDENHASPGSVTCHDRLWPRA